MLMRLLTAALLACLAASSARAQPAPDPPAQAMARARREAVGREVAAMTRLNVLEARVAAMEAEAKAKAAPVPAP